MSQNVTKSELHGSGSIQDSKVSRVLGFMGTLARGAMGVTGLFWFGSLVSIKRIGVSNEAVFEYTV